MSNLFFTNKGPFKISKILELLKLENNSIDQNQIVTDVKDLFSASITDITFFHSKKYKDLAYKTKASHCITTQNLKDELPANCIPLIVENVLVSISLVTSKFYPESINDNFDTSCKNIDKTNFKDTVLFGQNVLVGENISIGQNCSIGHNTII